MKVFRRLVGFLAPYRLKVVCALVLAGAAMATAVLIPALVGRTVDEIRHGNSRLWPLLLLIIAAACARLVLSVLRRLVAGSVSLAVEYDLRNLLYGHLMSLELGFFDRQQTGQLMSRTTVDLQSVRFFLGYGLVFIMQSAVGIGVAAAVMVAVNPGLAAVALAPAPLFVWQAFRYGARNRPAAQLVQQRIAELTADAEENISAATVVKAFAQEATQLARFRDSVGRVFDQAMTSARLRAYYNPLLSFLPNLGLAAVLLVGGHEAISGSITVGDFVAFYGYVAMLTSPLRTLGVSLSMAQRAAASGARIFEVLDRRPRVVAPASCEPMPAGRGRIDVSGVEFSHNGSAPVLSDIDLTIEAGQTMAFVGPTGSGKTTLALLIPRLYDVTAGEIRIDGVEVSRLDPTELRTEIALVSDEPFLFSATLRDNIAYAKPHATDAEIDRVAGQADLAEFVERLPAGYDTLVGERGVTLSGGQRQRVALARALLKDPRILILDDATSSVDATTEDRIHRSLADVMAGRTTVVIAHRLSTISLADEIAVFDRGLLRARGTHAELLQRCDLYRAIVEGQPLHASMIAPHEPWQSPERL